jgi:hypothetical protein
VQKGRHVWAGKSLELVWGRLDAAAAQDIRGSAQVEATAFVDKANGFVLHLSSLCF